MKYTESYFLCHGTDQQSAEKIISEGFKIKGDSTSWCGKGAYFYDIKKKAWWAANRKCEQIKATKKIKIKPSIIFADIIDIPTNDIFDLRIKKDLEEFEAFTNSILTGSDEITISDISDDTERKIKLRAMLISFYADKTNCKLVIGNFMQRPQPLYQHSIEFANSLDMIFGIETIYCVKNTEVISNIRLGGNKK